MRVLVLCNAVPFIWGGAEQLSAHLTQQLNLVDGVEAELLRIPFCWEPKHQLVNEILLHRRLVLQNEDRVIALKFPTYLIPHEHKTLWILHQFRQAYDLLGTDYSFLNAADDRDIVEAIRRADNIGFAESRALFVNSPVTQSRLRQYNDAESQVLYPPLNDEHLFRNDTYGDIIIAGGRVEPGKRQHLLLEAMKFTSSDCHLMLVGPPGDAAYAGRLQQMENAPELEGRVTLDLRFVPRGELATLVNGARACAYIPVDEDSLGYVTMEAFAAGKAVVTTEDSGGLLEIVRDGETGRVTAPDPHAIAVALDDLANYPSRARQMGKAAADLWASKNITWPATIERLLAS